MKLSICILAYNRVEEVRKTLELIGRNVTLEHEVILLDNASTDHCTEIISKEFPKVSIITLQQNEGAPALNHAFSAAKGEYILILDDDSHPVSGLNEAIDYLDSAPQTGALALQIEGGGYRIKSKQHLDETIGYIGCGAIVRRKVIEEVGGYPEWIFLYSNEWEHGIRIRNAGYKIRYFKHCLIKHRVATTHRSNRRLRSLTTKNELLILERYFFNDPRLTKLKARTIRWNRFFMLLEGIQVWKHVNEGIRLYKSEKDAQPHIPISRQVRDSYVDQHWCLQPLWPAFFYRALEALELIKEPPRRAFPETEA